MNYSITWNDGQVDLFPMRLYNLQEVRELAKEVEVATHGAIHGVVGGEEDEARGINFEIGG